VGSFQWWLGQGVSSDPHLTLACDGHNPLPDLSRVLYLVTAPKIGLVANPIFPSWPMRHGKVSTIIVLAVLRAQRLSLIVSQKLKRRRGA
jgi:hypothetical protein